MAHRDFIYHELINCNQLIDCLFEHEIDEFGWFYDPKLCRRPESPSREELLDDRYEIVFIFCRHLFYDADGNLWGHREYSYYMTPYDFAHLSALVVHSPNGTFIVLPPRFKPADPEKVNWKQEGF